MQDMLLLFADHLNQLQTLQVQQDHLGKPHCSKPRSVSVTLVSADAKRA